MNATPELPDGMRPLSPHLAIRGAAAAIDFYEQAFGARELMRLAGPDGKIMHAALEINGGSVMLVDENLEYGMRSPLDLGGTPVSMHLVVADADEVFDRAVAAGATVRQPVAEQFWGDRYGVLEDPFGHVWAVASPTRGPMTTDELNEAMNTATPM